MQKPAIERLPNFLQAETLMLEEMNDKHLALLQKWHSDPTVSSVTHVEDFAKLDDLMAWYFSRYLSARGQQRYYMIRRVDEEKPYIGYASLISTSSDTVELGIVVEAEHRSCGVGTNTLSALCSSAFKNGMRKITARVLPNNERAIRLLQSVNFSKDGLLRQEIYQAGKYVDVFLFSKLQTDS